MGWVNQPFDDEITCTAYSQVYSKEMQKRAPESTGELFCVKEGVLKSAMENFDLIEMKRLEDIPNIE